MRREDQANFHNLLMQTSNAGRFAFRVTADGEPEHACPDCGAPFPQTDEGWAALKEHQMEHGRPHTYGAEELKGKTLQMFVVETDDHDERSAFDIYGQDDTGTVYHLATQSLWKGSGLWKWKRPSFPLKSLLPPMQSGEGSLLNGSKSTGGK